MNYIYSNINRLKEPHNYMYTPYQGIALLQSYESSRMAVIDRKDVTENSDLNFEQFLLSSALPVLENLIKTNSREAGRKFQTLLKAEANKVYGKNKEEDDNLSNKSTNLENITIAESILTLNLLYGLISALVVNNQQSNTKIWLDRLVQRFEVSKKLYESYLPGFRKGQGDNTSIRLYWLFALTLSLYYARTNEIKYLSTLLKLGDLLCSLPKDVLYGHSPQYGLSAVIATELISIQLLSEKKGISFASY